MVILPGLEAGVPETLLSEILEHLQDGVYALDRERRVIFWNQAAERITGCKAEEVLGRNVADLVREGYVNESVTLEVLNTLGQTVAIVASEILAAGSHSNTWNAGEFPSGLYFYLLESNNQIQMKKMTLVK